MVTNIINGDNMENHEIIEFFENIPNIKFSGMLRDIEYDKTNYLKGLFNVNNAFKALEIDLYDYNIYILFKGNETIDLTDIDNGHYWFGNTHIFGSEIVSIEIKY